MATKIINVLKDDKFEDILNIFRKTPAQEVIFVLPKKAKAFDKEENFSLLAQESQDAGKSVLVMASDPAVINMATKYELGVLLNEVTQKKKKEATLLSANLPHKKSSIESIILEPVKESIATDEPESTITDEVSNIEDRELESKDEDSEDNTVAPLSAGIAEDEVNVDNAVADFAENSPVDNEFESPYIIQTAVKRSKPITDVYESESEEQASNLKISRRSQRLSKIPLKKAENSDRLSSGSDEVLDMRKKSQDNITDQLQNIWKSYPGESSFRNKSYKQKRYSASNFSLKFQNLSGFFHLKNRALVIFGGLAIIILGVIVYVSVGSAKVFLKSRPHDLKFSMQVSVSDKYLSMDVDSRKIPGQLFSIRKSVEKSFPATGEKDVAQKARGMLTVYNEYGTAPQILIATTRFESEKGLIFRTLKTITVPGTTVKNGVITPGQVTVEVIADKAGSDYNIEPGKFTIPAFKEKGDTDRFGKYYAKSSELIRGGIIGKAKVITEQDYMKAKTEVQEEAINEVKQALATQTANLEIINFYEPKISEIKATGQIDEAVDNFSVSSSAELETMGYKKDDLYSLISAYVQKTNDFIIFPEKLDIKIEDTKINQEQKIVGFTSSVKGSGFSKIDQEMILNELLNKNEAQIKDYLKNMENIVSAKVILSPFWVKKVPRYKEKVKIEIQYD